MNKAVVYNNNSVVSIAWEYDKPIAGCLGFDVRRTLGTDYGDISAAFTNGILSTQFVARSAR